MPLAVARLDATALPAQVTLNDRMGMTARVKLSDFSVVKVEARISQDGAAIAKPGDLTSTSTQVPSSRREPVELVIDKIIE